MPLLHRWLGQSDVLGDGAPMVRAPIHDVYCGLRGFTTCLLRFAGPALHRHGVRDGDDHQVEPPPARGSAEVPITLHPDGRKSHAPHLRTVP